MSISKTLVSTHGPTTLHMALARSIRCGAERKIWVPMKPSCSLNPDTRCKRTF